MHLEDFDVVILGEGLGRDFDQLQRHIDTDAHVWRENDRYVPACRVDPLPFFIRKSRRSNDDRATVPHALLQMGERSRRTGEVDEHIGIGDCADIVGDEHGRTRRSALANQR